MDQEELELEQDEMRLSHARLVALVVLVIVAAALYVGSLLIVGFK